MSPTSSRVSIVSSDPYLDPPIWIPYLDPSGPIRSRLRLHPGPFSTGCVTVPDGGDYQRIRDIIENTRTSPFQDAGANARTRYGTMHVFSSTAPRAVFP